jgi:hypothetical protein
MIYLNSIMFFIGLNNTMFLTFKASTPVVSLRLVVKIVGISLSLSLKRFR